MVFLRLLAVATCGFLIVSPAGATTFFDEEFTCPVGGEKFTAAVIGSSSSWGQRPDGMSIGGVAPWPVVECPQNGLPLYREEFDRDEIEQLATLIQTPEFQQMRRDDTPYKRIWWLRSKLGAEPYSLAVDLLQASWEPSPVSALRSRYQLEFAEAAIALQRTEERADDWFWLTLRAANAYRENRMFDKAGALLASINSSDMMPADPDDSAGARRIIDALSVLISEENSYFEPTNMMDPMIAADRCIAPDAEMSASEKTACNSPEYREAISDLRDYQADNAEADAEANIEAMANSVEDTAEAPK